MKILLSLLGGVVFLIVGAFALQFAGFASFAFFSPKYEAVRRDTAIESRAYSEATIRRLYDMKREYEQADTPSAKATVAAAARHEYSIFPEDRLPADLKVFMSVVK